MNSVKYVGMDVHKGITVIVVLNWLWQGGLAPFGIFIWPHPLT